MPEATNMLLRKLTALHSLSGEEQRALLRTVGRPRTLPRGRDIAREGDSPSHSTVLLSGSACRYKNLSNGKRHILTFQYPGDMVDLYSYVMKRLDHSIGTLSQCVIAEIPHDDIQRL